MTLEQKAKQDRSDYESLCKAAQIYPMLSSVNWYWHYSELKNKIAIVNSVHGYTEGSEPTSRCCPVCNSMAIMRQAPSDLIPSIHLICTICKAEFVGVEEKKEPETAWIEILKGMTEGSQPAQIHRYRNELKSLLTYLRGVSGREEPTQEELWVEFWRQYHSVEYASNTQIRLSQKWKIQKI